MKKILTFLLCVLFIMVSTVYALIYANEGCVYLDPPCDVGRSNGGEYASLSLKYLNVMGASFLLKSKSDYSQLLALVELAEMVEVNQTKVKQYLLASVTNLMQARLYYYIYVIESEYYGYIEERIKKLKEFDFFSFYRECNRIFSTGKNLLVDWILSSLFNLPPVPGWSHKI